MPPSSVSHREVFRLAWPMIVSNCSIPLLGIVDTAILGHLNNATYLGAVAVGANILSFLLWGFGFLRMGTTSEIARALGRGDGAAQERLLAQSVALALGIALVVVIASPLLFPLALTVMAPADDIRGLALSYCLIRISSAPATMLSYVMVGWFIGMQRTREPLLITITTNSINIGLDALLILGFGMQSDGAALATVIAEYSGLLLALWLLRRQLRAWPNFRPLNRLLRGCSQLFSTHWHLFVRTLCLLFAFAFFTAQGARQGQDVLAANAILMQLLGVVSYGLDGFAHAAEAMIGRASGARSQRDFIAASWLTAQWSLLTALTFTVIFLLAQRPVMALMTDIESVSAITAVYFPWLIALPLVSVWCYWLDGVFIGAGKTLAMRNTMLIACVAIFLPLWFFSRPLANHGLWLSFLSFNGARGIIMLFFYWRFTRSASWY